MDEAIIAESARWGDAHSDIPRTRDDDWLPEVNWVVDQFFPTRVDNMLKQLRAQKLYPDFNPPVFNLTGGKVSKGTVLTIDTTEGPVYYTVDGNDTRMPSSLQKSYQTIVVPRNAEKRVLVPVAKVDIKWRYDLKFNDASWTLCNNSPGGIGYDLGSKYDDLISFDIKKQMYNVNSTCMIRIPFEVTQEQLNDFSYMTLRVQYDDGFIAYLNNSSPILIRNFSGGVNWNSTANKTNDGKFIESIDITPYLSKLVPGKNLLGIQAVNIAPADSDFLISVELIAGNPVKSSSPISPSAIAYKGPITIDHTTKIKARVYKDEKWSALNEVALWVPEGNDNLKISEIHYHPLGEEGIDEKEFEFIELKNAGTASLNLSGMTFSKGIEYTFPSGTIIEPDSFLVLASNAQVFETRYPFAPDGEYNGQLDNGGETIILQTSKGDTIINLTYDNNYPWPHSPDGSGYSLVRKPERLYDDENDPSGWCSSVYIHGNPGFNNDADSVFRKEIIPGKFRLLQNYPNPFNLLTIISFSLPSRCFVTLKVFDLIGREVATIVSEELSPNTYIRQWNAKGLASGIYFYQLRAGNYIETRKLVLLK